MAVLLASWSELDVYESALRDIGAPTYSLRITGFYETSEISDLVVALRAIRDLRDDRALFGFLRGPFVGVSDETLMRIARAGDSPYWSVIARAEAENVILRSEATKDPLSSLTDHDERARLDWGTSLLTRFGALRDRTPAASLLETLLNESGHLAYLAMMGERGRQQIANVRKFLQIVRGMPSASIADVLATVERARDLQAIEGDARLYGAQDDVLTITSIHSSKGLEWPVVFWADLVRTKAPPRSKLVISEGDIALADPKITDATAQPAHYRALRERVDHEENAEAKRLWYVAATRAKDLLVVSGIPVTGARKTSPADAIKGILPALDVKTITYSSRAGQKFVARVREVALLEVDDPMPSMTYGLTQVDVSQHSPATDGPLAPLVSPPNDVAVPAGRTRHSATELLLLQRCPRKRWFKYVIGLREPASERSGSADEVDAVRRGLIVHDVLEHFSEDEELSVFLEDAIGRWDPEAPPPDAKRGHRYRASLRKDLESVLSHPEYRAVFDRPDAERELSFVRIKRRGTYVEGQIDLVAPNDCSGYSVIDVKTSQCDADAAAKKAEQYAVQKAVYVDALEEIGTRPVESFGFQFSGPGVQVGGTISADEREKLGLELAQAVQAMRTDPTVPPPMTTNPQECRFCGYRRAGWCAGAPDL
jgi:ATP-dependent exoDNAse (exonuclease V) beta subunit